LVAVLLYVIADMTTTSIGLRLGMPERNRIPRWFFDRFGRVRGPIVYTPFEVLLVYACLSLAYIILLPARGQTTSMSIVFDIAVTLTVVVVVNNTTKVVLKRRKLKRAADSSVK
jgi:hypothetical protein